MFSSASDKSSARAIFILPLRVLFSRCLFRSGVCARPQLLERRFLARQDLSALSCSGHAVGSSSDSFGLCVPQCSCFDFHPRLQIPGASSRSPVLVAARCLLQVLLAAQACSISRFWPGDDRCFSCFDFCYKCLFWSCC
jgi:hypothetical protein